MEDSMKIRESEHTKVTVLDEPDQSGPYPCYENNEALIHLRTAEGMLEQRTISRKQRGVEGKNIK